MNVDGRVPDERLYFCAHCEDEFLITSYMTHIAVCLVQHIHEWPHHNDEQLCGKPHYKPLTEKMQYYGGWKPVPMIRI